MNEEAQPLPDTLPEVAPLAAEAAEATAASALLPTLGELMIAARERWNLSAGDVARQLRLGLRQVEALEANRFDTLPGNTFVRGFIRNYAKVVQIDPATFLEAYERSRPQIQPPEIVAQTEQIDFTKKPIPKWVWYIGGAAAAAVLLPLAIYLALQDDEAPANAAPQAVAPKAAVAQPGQAHETPLTLPPPQAVSLGEAPAPAEAKPQGALIPPAALPGAAGLAKAAGPVLKLKFEGDAWVEIRDKSGKKIFSELSRAGSEKTVQGEPPLSLVVGDAAKVRITYNGKPVDLTPHVKKTVARLTLE
ncbi:MAG: helix-turn-helix domain-containing protein [Hydrogenophilales bacterium]|nr:helix-turn-helix domain-containing protein [Hydrogenophilales bacterium]